MYTSCHNYSFRSKGHRANGFTTDGGFAEYAINDINTLVPVPDYLSDEVATLTVTAGTAMYGLDVFGGLVAGGGPIVLMFIAISKALGAAPVIISEPREDRREMAKNLGADILIDPLSQDPVEYVKDLTDGKGVDFAVEDSDIPDVVNQVLYMTNRGGKVCWLHFLTA